MKETKYMKEVRKADSKKVIRPIDRFDLLNNLGLIAIQNLEERKCEHLKSSGKKLTKEK
jgi:hypothetical protein